MVSDAQCFDGRPSSVISVAVTLLIKLVRLKSEDAKTYKQDLTFFSKKVFCLYLQ